MDTPQDLERLIETIGNSLDRIEAIVQKDVPRCLQEGDDCKGKVEYHLNPDRDDFKSFPRCEYHQSLRLKSAERTRELLSDCEPDWFDPSYAGERWSDDY